MPRDEWGFAEYVPVEQRRREAEKLTAKLRKKGRSLTPVIISGRHIATTFWGKSWCSNMDSYRDYETRLPRGRSYARNGSVIDLQINPGKVTALVYGSELYRTAITIKEMPPTQWHALCRDCAGRIDSLVELLQGRFSEAVMGRFCRQDNGLFPKPVDIRFTCSCPDHASMCKHVAAVLYGVGARLDLAPELLFRLRGVDQADLVAGIDTVAAPSAPTKGKKLRTDDVSALFGLDMAGAEPERPRSKARSRQGRPG